MSSPTLPPAVPAALARAVNLPTIPAVAVEVMRLTQDDDCTLDDLARVIQRDPALAAKLLKLSNSALFSLGQEVTTLKRAAMVLGMKTVKLMSLSFSLATSLPRQGTGFDFNMYWQRSLVAAVAGRSFAQAVGSKHGDEAFLCGLLSHLGQAVLAQCLGDMYAAVLERSAGRWPTLELEQRVLGFSSSDVAYVLLRDWNLPELIRIPVAYMQRPRQVPAEVGEEAREVTRLMSLTALVLAVLCDREQGTAYRRLYAVGEHAFRIDQARMDACLLGLEPCVRETADLLNVKLPAELDHREILERARMQLVNVSLGATADLRLAERRADDLSVRNKELLDRATHDKLTGLPNRAAFDEALARELAARRTAGARSLGLVMIDLDRFKRLNDTHGHRAGDAVLEAIGRVLLRETRQAGLAARYGGEEFAVILPATAPLDLREAAERMRLSIAAEVIPFEGRELRVTASFGVACLAGPGSAADGARLVQAADACLYAAKDKGRNRTEVAAGPL